MKKLNSVSLDILSKYKSEIYGFCILWIMIFHSYLMKIDLSSKYSHVSYFDSFVKMGNQGVEIFLFLSGIFLYYSFSKNDNIYSFMKKRLLRLIYPVLIINIPYWIYVLIQNKITFGRVMLNITLTGFFSCGYTQIWFISTILLCYFMYPYIYHYIYKNNKMNYKKFAVVFGLSIAYLFAFMYSDIKSFNRYEIGLVRIPSFILGCGFGKMCKDKKKIPAAVLLVLFAIAIANFYVLHNDKLIGQDKIYQRLFGITAIPYAFIVAVLLNIVNCKFINKILAFFGVISLQIYVAHISLILLYRESSVYKPGNIKCYLLLLVIAVVIAYLASVLQNKIESLRVKQTK